MRARFVRDIILGHPVLATRASVQYKINKSEFSIRVQAADVALPPNISDILPL